MVPIVIIILFNSNYVEFRSLPAARAMERNPERERERERERDDRDRERERQTDRQTDRGTIVLTKFVEIDR